MKRRVLPLVFCLLLAVATGAARAADIIPLYATPIPLDANDDTRKSVGRLVYRGGIALESPDRRFGGLSDIAVSPDGTRLTAISDRGYWFQARLHYGGAGDIVSLSDGRLGPLIDTAGRTLRRSATSDAEGLTAYPDGSFAVSFERQHRIWLYPASEPPFSAPPRIIPSPPGLDEAPDNGGVEALLRLSGGRLLALTEALMEHGNQVGWIGDGVTWAELHYRAAPDFKPVSLAEFPPGTPYAGDVLVLERRLTLFDGPGIRVVRLRRGDIRGGAVLEGEELALLRLPLTIDNFEGIAIARGDGGVTRIYLLSDDNYSIFQRTLLMMFELVTGN